MWLLAIKFLLAHIIGDFMIQPAKWVKSKQNHKLRSPFLYLHLLVHLLALLVVFGFQFVYWPAFLVVIVSHFVIDVAKLYLHKKIKTIWLFTIDQALHLAVLFAVAYIYRPISFQLSLEQQARLLLLVTALFIITFALAVVIKVFISKWKVSDESLTEAGKYIGIMERLFIFFFVTQGIWTGIGFLLAAKSIFRFGDLTKNNDRKLTEYIVLGTFLSFGTAVLVGLLYNFAKSNLPVLIGD